MEIAAGATLKVFTMWSKSSQGGRSPEFMSPWKNDEHIRQFAARVGRPRKCHRPLAAPLDYAVGEGANDEAANCRRGASGRMPGDVSGPDAHFIIAHAVSPSIEGESLPKTGPQLYS